MKDEKAEMQVTEEEEKTKDRVGEDT